MTLTVRVTFCETFLHLCFQRCVKTPNNGALYVGIVCCMKINYLAFKALLGTCNNKLSTFIWLYSNWFSFPK